MLSRSSLGINCGLILASQQLKLKDNNEMMKIGLNYTDLAQKKHSYLHH